MTAHAHGASAHPAAGRETGAPASGLLQARDVTMQFGGLTAVNQVSLDIHRGEILGLIGPNGAGKTTFFNCLTGMYPPTSGSVLLDGQVLPPKPRKVAAAGVSRTFQNIRLFHNMTALENVMVARYCRTRTNALDAIFRLPRHRREEVETREVSQRWLEFVGLGHTTDLLSRNLPYGDQRRLEIARALALEPKLLLLDEPTAGMNPQETREAEELIQRIRGLDIAVLVIEHDMRFIFSLCDRVVCLVRGEVLVEGTPAEVQHDPRVIEAYIGGSVDLPNAAPAPEASLAHLQPSNPVLEMPPNAANPILGARRRRGDHDA
ncbi:ABC transporter ATP-binding protein [Propioniciclava soli]|uniref:ABC transporter ATP-binding protein n=1 Tax=Propioniciclava soli TaxID=2775081 RepID=UPI001E2935FB|nr:ABC transporter ATP-binding protein [Propioniciclava soli]